MFWMALILTCPSAEGKGGGFVSQALGPAVLLLFWTDHGPYIIRPSGKFGIIEFRYRSHYTHVEDQIVNATAEVAAPHSGLNLLLMSALLYRSL